MISKFNWDGCVFYIKVDSAAVDSYLYSVGIAEKSVEEFYSTLANFNLNHIIKNYIGTIYPGVIFEGLVQADELRDDDKELKISFECGEIGKIQFTLLSRSLTKLEAAYCSSGLKLEKHSIFEDEIEQKFGEYQLEIGSDNIISARERMLRCEIQVGEIVESIYVNQVFAEYLYFQYYPHYIPFQSSDYCLQVVANSINLWLRTEIKRLDITVIAIKLTKLPIAYYYTILVRKTGFCEKIYLNKNSQIFEKIKNMARKKIFDGAMLLDQNQHKVFLPVVECFFELSFKQLKNIKIGDTILLSEYEVENDTLLMLGQSKYLKCRDIGNNVLSIIG